MNHWGCIMALGRYCIPCCGCGGRAEAVPGCCTMVAAG